MVVILELIAGMTSPPLQLCPLQSADLWLLWRYSWENYDSKYLIQSTSHHPLGHVPCSHGTGRSQGKFVSRTRNGCKKSQDITGSVSMHICGRLSLRSEGHFTVTPAKMSYTRQVAHYNTHTYLLCDFDAGGQSSEMQEIDKNHYKLLLLRFWTGYGSAVAYNDPASAMDD